MASDPNRWFKLWDTFGTHFQKRWRCRCEVAVVQVGDGRSEKFMWRCWYTRSAAWWQAENGEEYGGRAPAKFGLFPRGGGWQQSSQQFREEEIFEHENRLKEELENKTKEELLALGTAVLHGRGEDWMQQRLSCMVERSGEEVCSEGWVFYLFWAAEVGAAEFAAATGR
eukprot:s70_g22.t1